MAKVQEMAIGRDVAIGEARAEAKRVQSFKAAGKTEELTRVHFTPVADKSDACRRESVASRRAAMTEGLLTFPKFHESFSRELSA